ASVQEMLPPPTATRPAAAPPSRPSVAKSLPYPEQFSRHQFLRIRANELEQLLQMTDARFTQRRRDAFDKAVSQRVEHPLILGAHQRPYGLPASRLLRQLRFGLAQCELEAPQQILIAGRPGFGKQIAQYRQLRLQPQRLEQILQGERRTHTAFAPHARRELPEGQQCVDRKSTRLNSSHVKISYAVFCLKKKKTAKRKRENKQ